MNPMVVLSCAVLAMAASASASYGYASHWGGPAANIQLSHDGKYVLDTPEVAHAKAAHAAAHANAAARSYGAGGWEGGGYEGAGYEGAVGHYGAPGAGLHKYGPAPLAHDGRVIDTPEVAHAKAAHYAAHAHAGHGLALAGPAAHGGGYGGGYSGGYGGGYGGGYAKWNGPQAHIQLTHDGKYVVDTPEVAHARAAHLAAYAHAAHGAGWGAGAGAGAYHGGYAHAAPIALSHDGFVLDTPEVAHAKAAHLAAHHAAGAGAHGGWY